MHRVRLRLKESFEQHCVLADGWVEVKAAESWLEVPGMHWSQCEGSFSMQERGGAAAVPGNPSASRRVLVLWLYGAGYRFPFCPLVVQSLLEPPLQRRRAPLEFQHREAKLAARAGLVGMPRPNIEYPMCPPDRFVALGG